MKSKRKTKDPDQLKNTSGSADPKARLPTYT